MITHGRNSISVGDYVEAGGAHEMISDDFNSPVSINDHWVLSNVSTIIGWFDFGTIRTKGILGDDDHGLGIVSGKNTTN